MSIASSEDLTGRVLGGYHFDQLLTEGGMGNVFVCSRNGVRYIAKVPLTQVSYANYSRKYLRNEVEVLREIKFADYENIVRYVDDFVEDGIQVLILEFISGENLQDAIFRKRITHLPQAQRAEIFAQVLKIVGSLHRQNLILRDLKPDNVMLTDLGGGVYQAKLIDFGCAKMSHMTQIPTAGTVVGTVGYTAPEQSYGGKFFPQSDLFSMGMILYFVLAEKHPPTLEEIEKGEDDLDWSAIQPRFVPIIRKATEWDWKRRYRSVDEFADALGFPMKGDRDVQPPYLIVQGHKYPMNKREIFFGRRVPPPHQDDLVDIRIPDISRYISRRHCRIALDENGHWFLEDLGSQWGTWVLVEGEGWQRKTRWYLKNHTRFSLGFTSDRGSFEEVEVVLQ